MPDRVAKEGFSEDVTFKQPLEKEREGGTRGKCCVGGRAGRQTEAEISGERQGEAGRVPARGIRSRPGPQRASDVSGCLPLLKTPGMRRSFVQEAAVPILPPLGSVFFKKSYLSRAKGHLDGSIG